MAGISVCMIVKNEEEVLARCLACVTSFADEIIVVDTGSTDKTKAIAADFTDKIYDFAWCDDFSKARNYSFSKATQDFIMWLDADDVIVQYEDIAITHRKLHVNDPDRNLRIFEKLLAQGKQLDAREQFYYARELYYHARYHDALQVFEAFLNGKQGWVENNIDACEMMGYCHSALQQKDEMLQAYLRSFQYDAPRAELCCDIGKYFFDEKRWKEAVFWYETALHRTRDDKSGAFVRVDCYGYLPAIQLCVCYWQLHDRQASMHYNDIAGRYKPDSTAVQQNRKFFGNAS